MVLVTRVVAICSCESPGHFEVSSVSLRAVMKALFLLSPVLSSTVVSCHSGSIRFDGLSSCSSIAARFHLLPMRLENKYRSRYRLR